MPLVLALIFSLALLTGCAAPRLSEANSTQINNILKDQVRFVLVADNLKKVTYENGSLSFRAEKQMTSFGTGAALTSDGYVLTAAHVVQGAAENSSLNPWVVAYDHGEAQFQKAEVVWQNPAGDLALLKVSVTNAPHFNWCASGKLRRGTRVIQGGARSMRAVGKITFDAELDKEDEPFIQIYHSTRVRKGDSGGPLMNERGELIGINTLHIYLRIGPPGMMINGGAVIRPNVHVLNEIIETDRNRAKMPKSRRIADAARSASDG